ncbi:MAG: chromate transporter, partial [Chthoniobacterales bacterium]
IRIGRKALRNEIMWGIAIMAFVAIYFLKLPFPLIVLSAGVVGLVGGRVWPAKFLTAPGERDHSDNKASHDVVRMSWWHALRIVVVCVGLWVTPTLIAGLTSGWDSTLFREGIFFSKAALVTFGGAYAVLPYVAQQAVQSGWLQPGQMMDGLGLAETTPGPLIMVVQFVGFVGAWQNPGNLSPLLAATLGALITTWATFTPCFLWIFLGAPYIERLRGNLKLGSALSAITAAIVGVILNLAVWFALHVFFPPVGGVDWFAIALSAMAFVGMLRWNWGVIPVVLGAGALGLAYRIMLSF